MGANDVVLNITYVLYVVAPLVRDELRFRVVLAMASVGFGTWGLLDRNVWPVVWNALFLSISIWKIRKLMRDRKDLSLTPELEQVRASAFPEMNTRQFQRFWDLGSQHLAVDEQLTVEGAPVAHFWVFLDGTVEVQLTDSRFGLAPHSTIGGMSYVGGADVAATATVQAISAELRRWDKQDLRRLEVTDPDLVAPFLSGVARGLAAKIPT